MATSAAQIAKTGKYGDLRRRLVFLLMALIVYRIGAQAWLDGQPLYGQLAVTQAGLSLPFTYPPFAALLAIPLAMMPMVPPPPASAPRCAAIPSTRWPRRRRLRLPLTNQTFNSPLITPR